MNQKIFCLKHPKYDGKKHPKINCRVCCSIFIEDLKENDLSKLSFKELIAKKSS